MLVTGANGQLGSDVCEVFAGKGWTVATLTQGDIDLETAAEADVAALIAQRAPHTVVNCAAYTNVDKAESEPARAFAVNATAVRALARGAARCDALFVQISTDYVFDGEKQAPYLESDATRPLQVYGISKLAGEHFARAEAPRHAIVRTCGLYGANPCIGKGGANFVRTMLQLASERDELAVVDDEFATPTFTRDLAAQLEKIAAENATGVFHATQHGGCSWHDFAAAIFELSGAKVKLTRNKRANYQSAARRPAYTVLDNARLSELGLDVMADWKDALRRYLAS